MFPVRNITFLNILSFDILIPFFLTAISNAMCDIFLWCDSNDPVFGVKPAKIEGLEYTAPQELEQGLIS